MKKYALLPLLGALFTTGVQAEQTPPPIIQNLPGHPAVLASLPVKGTPLTAWLLRAGKRLGVVYTGTKGDYLIAGGEIMTSKGLLPVSRQLLSDYYSQHNFKALVDALQSAKTIHQGKSGPLIYVFWDPNCIYCHKLWDELQPAIKTGRLQVNWVPVGVIKRSSPAKAAAILAAKSPLQAMQEDESRFNPQIEEGGITVPKHIPERFLRAVSANTRLFEENSMQGTPSILYRAKNGAWHVIPGYISLNELSSKLGFKL